MSIIMKVKVVGSGHRVDGSLHTYISDFEQEFTAVDDSVAMAKADREKDRLQGKWGRDIRVTFSRKKEE